MDSMEQNNKQMMIVVFKAPDRAKLKEALEKAADVSGNTYFSGDSRTKSVVPTKPMVVSVKSNPDTLMGILGHLSGGFLMVDIGMERDDVFAVGEDATNLFFIKPGAEKKLPVGVSRLEPAAAVGVVKKKNESVPNYNLDAELKSAVTKEDYMRAALIRDIINGTATNEDLKNFDNKNKKK